MSSRESLLAATFCLLSAPTFADCLEQVLVPNETAAAQPLTPLFDREEQLWFVNESRVASFDGFKLIHPWVPPELASTSASILLRDQDSTIVVVHSDGEVSRLVNETLVPVLPSFPAEVGPVIAGLVDRSGRVWAGSQRGGLLHWDGNQWMVDVPALPAALVVRGSFPGVLVRGRIWRG